MLSSDDTLGASWFIDESMSISRKLDKLAKVASDARRDWRCGLLFCLFAVVYAHPSHMVSLQDPDLDLERY